MKIKKKILFGLLGLAITGLLVACGNHSSATKTEKAQKQMFLEIIMMTYSYVHRAINSEAFPNALDLYDKQLMTGRGRGR